VEHSRCECACAAAMPDGPAGVAARLTDREREVLRRIVDGESTKEIARGLVIARSTARTHAQNVLVKLGVHSRLQAAAIVARGGAVGLLSP
jgi:two-component system nitrate/nitrite response regulator NarL